MAMLRSIAPEGLAISLVTYGEVLDGILTSPEPTRNNQRWQEFLAPFTVLNITLPIAEIWAELRGRLRTKGAHVPDADLLIAATALYLDMTVVTGNIRHFGRIAGLEVLEAPQPAPR